jgi:hypothetical protein
LLVQGSKFKVKGSLKCLLCHPERSEGSRIFRWL